MKSKAFLAEAAGFARHPVRVMRHLKSRTVRLIRQNPSAVASQVTWPLGCRIANLNWQLTSKVAFNTFVRPFLSKLGPARRPSDPPGVKEQRSLNTEGEASGSPAHIGNEVGVVWRRWPCPGQCNHHVRSTQTRSASDEWHGSQLPSSAVEPTMTSLRHSERTSLVATSSRSFMLGIQLVSRGSVLAVQRHLAVTTACPKKLFKLGTGDAIGSNRKTEPFKPC